MKRIMLLVMSAMIALVITGCDDFEKNCYSTLVVGEQGYIMVMETTGDLYKDHLIGDDVKDEIITLGNLYKAAYKSAQLALYMYHNSDKNKPLKLEVIKAFSELGRKTDDLRKIYNNTVEGVKGVKKWTKN